MQYLIVNIVIVLVLGPLVWQALRWLDRKIHTSQELDRERARARWKRQLVVVPDHSYEDAVISEYLNYGYKELPS